MPYALFCQDAKISKAYPTEAAVWKHALDNGLVVDIASTEKHSTPERVLDNDYAIRPCEADAPEKQRDPKATDFELRYPT